jgi:hypothetical protein
MELALQFNDPNLPVYKTNFDRVTEAQKKARKPKETSDPISYPRSSCTLTMKF